MSLRNCCTFAVVSALLLAGATRAPASLIYDLRLHNGGGKSLDVQKGDTVNLDLYAVVKGADGMTNEGYEDGFGSFLATGSSIKGGLTLSIQPAFKVGSYQQGVTTDLDGDMMNNDIGSNDPLDTSNYVFFRAGFPPVTSGNPLPSGQGIEFLIATLVYSVTDVLTLGGQVSINFRAAVFGNATTEAVWVEDGNSTNSNKAGIGYGDGAPVLIRAIPEPGTASLLAAGLVVGFLRRRRFSPAASTRPGEA